MSHANPQVPDSSDPNLFESSRRLFLTRSLKTASLAVPAMALASSSAQAAGKKKTVTAQASTPSLGSPLPEYFGGQNKSFFTEIMSDENNHVEFLTTVLGTNARPKPTFQNLTASTYQQFLAMSTAFENTGAGAYQGAAPVIFSSVRLAAVAQLAFVEAYHSGWLNALSDFSLIPGDTPFSPALTIAEVVAAVTPYIASLNGGPPASFSTTPSDANDTAIFNFALILEYLEQEFYNTNVPIFYP